MAVPRHFIPIASASIVCTFTACSDPLSRPHGQAWQPPADADSQSEGSANIPEDDDGQWPDPTQGRLPDDDTADSSIPDPEPDDTAGADTDAATTGVPGAPQPSPYAGGWDIGNCQDDIAAGGDVVADFELLDANGDTVRLYDFCHKAVFLTDGAFW